MGIDIQQYRAKIGCFLIRKNSLKSTYSLGNTSRKRGPFFIKMILILSIIFPIRSKTVSNDTDIYSSSLTSVFRNTYKISLASVPLSVVVIRGGVYIVPAETSSSNRWFRIISNSKMRRINGNGRNRIIKIAHWNKGSSLLVNKIQEVKAVLALEKAKIFGLSEANLLAGDDRNLVSIADYNLHVSKTINNPNLKVSRVVAYMHTDITAKLRHDLMSDNFSSIWFEVGLPNKKKFLVCQVYREWQQGGNLASGSVPEQLRRWNVFLDQWETALSLGMEVHCVGDMNLNHCNWTDPNISKSNQSYKLRQLISNLFTQILSLGIVQLVSGPTRHFPGQISTGLDHFYTNMPEKISCIQRQYCSGSDHMLISGVRRAKSFQGGSKYVRRRSFRNFDPTLFKSAVQKLSWLDLYLTNDVDEAVFLLSSKLREILDQMAPMRTFQMRKSFTPWLSQETLKLIRDRDALYKLAVETKDRDDWKRYKKVRNIVSNRLRYEESNWHKNSLSRCEKDPSQSWKAIKNVLNWTSGGPPEKLFHDGSLKTKSFEIAEAQNNFFVEKINAIKTSMPRQSSDPLTILKSIMRNKKSKFHLKHVHPDQVETIIAGLKNSNSFGLDEIDTYVIKLVCREILPAVTHIINLSISTETFPSSWKRVKIIPLHKKLDRLNPKNYRPVALVPVMSKILEKVIFSQMMTYLEDNKLLNSSHHAYKAHYNTTTALIEMYDGWINALESGKKTGLNLFLRLERCI